MIQAHIFTIFALSATLASAYFSDTGNFGFLYFANMTDPHTAMVCITGKVAPNTYIALGIPRNNAEPHMMAADLTLAYYNGSGVVVAHGRGMAMDQLNYVDDSMSGASNPLTFDALHSAYANSLLTACFERQALNTYYSLLQGQNSFLWATGNVVNGVPHYHDDNKGIVNATLFGLPSSFAKPEGNALAQSTTGTATSGASVSATVAFFLVACFFTIIA